MARRLGVSREDVVAAAVTVADRDGLHGLTVAAVAGEVGCRPPSVYHHVDGLDGLQRAVAGVAAAELRDLLEQAAATANGADAISALTSAAHAWGTAHPARFDALCQPVDADVDPELAVARHSVLLPVQDALAAAGIPTEQRPPALAALVAAVRGVIAADNDALAVGASMGGARSRGHDLLLDLVQSHLAGLSADDPSVATT